MVISLTHKFKVPQIDMYHGSKDPIDYLKNFKAHIMLYDFVDEIACRAFLLALRGTTRGLFETLKPRSIDSFKELVKQFLTQFIPSRRHRQSIAYLLIVK